MNKCQAVYFIVLMTLLSCGSYTNHYDTFRKMHYSEEELAQQKTKNDSSFLKAHDFDGNVYVFLGDWKIDTSLHTVSGNAQKYNAERNLIKSGHLTVLSDSVILFETNQKLNKNDGGIIAAKTLLVMYNVLITGLCLSTPKACWGSCPTFYTSDNDNVFVANAEGFSNAISPSLEYEDIDDLGFIANGCKNFSLTMKNEALETHVIDHVNLALIPVSGDGYVFHGTDNRFYTSSLCTAPQKASIGGKDIIHHINKKDGNEWTSLADKKDLVTKEELILEFDANAQKTNSATGLVLTFRQTLMTTYLLYHAISYMGDEYSDIMSKLERDKKLKKEVYNAMYKTLGGVEVYFFDERKKNWEYQGEFYETGPIASNTQILPFTSDIGNTPNKIKIKLLFNKGLWRFDDVRLARIDTSVEPEWITPNILMLNDTLGAEELLNLSSDDKRLITFPGEVYDLKYKIPCAEDKYHVFLSSKGYYLEWMRSNWLKDKNLYKLHQMFKNPKKWLKKETEKYTFYESQMEEDFKNSRIQQSDKKLQNLLYSNH
ncbi:MAG: hypothetical protein IPN49_02680 [Saprospiraceae bacterium]|nr:hypothetical protein [Saprospiraceae bacterium]MBK8370082.1 hypothetical protein [Saprospiraceae bacterium]MBK8818033.1 hypothetical protein [Saprospiraceae bacterium]MBK9042794.1 hypothetical protein [Saprospiraceae bacterium]